MTTRQRLQTKVQQNKNPKVSVQPKPNPTTASKQAPKVNNTNSTKPILRIDPVKKMNNDVRNAENLKAKLASTQHPVPHTQTLPQKQAKDKKKKKWYDKILDTADSVVKHLLPYAPMLLGLGDYEESSVVMSDPPQTNTLLTAVTGGKMGNEIPYMHSKGEVVRLAHREYLGDVYSSTAGFTTQEFDLNPGLASTLPWLSPIAAQFTSYKFGGVAVEFNSLGSDYSDAAGLGYVALANQYNVDEPPFDNKRDMLNSTFADSAKPSVSFCSFIECSPEVIGLPKKFIRTGDVADNIDLNLYDHGRFTLAVGGNTEDSVAIGELYITYDIELFLPRPNEENISAYSGYNFSGVVANNAPLGTTFSKISGSKFGLDLSSNRIAFPKALRGEFYFEITWTSSTPVVGMNPPTVTGVGCLASNYNPILIGTGSTGGVGVVARRGKVKITNDGAYLDIGAASTLIGTGVTGTITFIILPDGITTPDKPISKIFDFKGINREIKYEEFIDQFRTQPKPEWIQCLITDNFTVYSKEKLDSVKYRFQHKDCKESFPLSEKVFRAIRNSPNANKVLLGLFYQFRGDYLDRSIEDLI